MGRLGISIYPEHSTFEKDKAYLDLAHQYGFTRVFTSLLQITDDQEMILNQFKKVVNYAKMLGFEVIVDINPDLFEQLHISYNDLQFFADMGADGIRLDLGFTGQEEAEMTRNPYGLKIEINMSQGTDYVDNIMSFSPNRENLYGSHNFYPHRYSGLSFEHFKKCTKKFQKYNLNTMAFVNSHDATFGPWPMQEGLCTLEEHRDLPIATQVKHYKLMDNIDDITIGNAYASEAELKMMSEAFFSDYPEIRVDITSDIHPEEEKAIFDTVHRYRGDRSEYLLRSTQTRVTYKNEPFKAHDTRPIQPYDILIDNEHYGQYKGETQIALKAMPNTDKRVNVVGHVVKDEMFLIPFLQPWSGFKFVRNN